VAEVQVKGFNVRIPVELIRRVRAYAMLQGKTTQELVCEILKAAVPVFPTDRKREKASR
jgi:predicted HicB family RNase H-like nuclease